MRFVLSLLALLAACSAPPPARTFVVGLMGPVAPRVAAEAARLGLEVCVAIPAGAAAESAAVPIDEGSVYDRVADWGRLRFLLWRAAARGKTGVYFRLPATSAGQDILDYPEEWQAVARLAREAYAAHSISEAGSIEAAPFPVSAGVDARAWSLRGRRYVLLVNSSSLPAPLDGEHLASWRALFEVRADARTFLPPCGRSYCLPPERVLWLEGRL